MNEPAAKQLRVLIVDDEPAIRQVLTDTIQYGGHAVVGTAVDGVDAVAKAQALRPDVVVMDVIMPSMNGAEAMEAILRAQTARRVLLISGECRSLGYTMPELLRRGAAAFLEKPFGVDVLLGLLDRWAREA